MSPLNMPLMKFKCYVSASNKKALMGSPILSVMPKRQILLWRAENYLPPLGAIQPLMKIKSAHHEKKPGHASLSLSCRNTLFNCNLKIIFQ